MHSITDVIAHFKQSWTDELSSQAIAQACRDAGMRWYESALNPVATIQIFFLQVLHGNTACEHLPHLSKMSFTAAAYCKARMRVKLEVLCKLLERCVVRWSSFKKMSSIPDVGWGTACFTSTAPASRCPILPSCRPISVNLTSRNQAAVFPRRTGWFCCTRARA